MVSKGLEGLKTSKTRKTTTTTITTKTSTTTSTTTTTTKATTTTTTATTIRFHQNSFRLLLPKVAAVLAGRHGRVRWNDDSDDGWVRILHRILSRY